MSVNEIRFEWDPVKAAGNLAKHGVSFEQAMSVFADPLSRSIVDPASPQDEERWITIGLNPAQKLLVVVHTHVGISDNIVVVRVTSRARPRRTNGSNMSKKEFDEMAEEYDFSKAERGRFFHEGAVLSPPVYLDPSILKLVQATAQERGMTLNALVSQLLKKDIELIEPGH